MNIQIRKAVEADSYQLWTLMRALAVFEKYIDAFAITPDVVRECGFRKSPPDFHCFVADDQGTIAGMLVYYFLPYTAGNRPAIFMKELYVDDTYRGQKIGEQLMEALKQEAILHRCKQIKWGVAPWNEGGLRFYERLGARENKDWLNYEWNMEMEIRRVTLADVNELQQIGRQTFAETFSASNTESNMEQYLDEGFAIEKLTEELAAPESAFYFAVLNDVVIGYLKVNTGQSQTVLKDEQSLEIERIYVLQQYHGQKAGQLLIEKAMQLAEEKGAAYVWLGVWEKNPRAIRFYQKNGFVAFDQHIFKLGDDAQTDIMMKKQLAI